MGEIRDELKAESPAAAFDRMRRPKNGIDDLGDNGARIHGEQTLLHDIQPFEAFLEEHLMELRHVDAHGYPQVY